MTRSPTWNPVTPAPTAVTTPGCFAAPYERRVGPELILAGEDQHVDVLHAADADPHLDFTRPGRGRIGHIA